MGHGNGSGRVGLADYMEDVEAVATGAADWSAIDGAAVAVAGATGMIGAFLVDVLAFRARNMGTSTRVLALGRDESKARGRLPYFGEPFFSFEEIDVGVPGSAPRECSDLVLHLASTTHPRDYARHPVGTVTANIVGLANLMEYAAACSARVLFASSVEVYGAWRGDVPSMAEDYCGRIDCATMRACYPEAKRCCEALCQAYAAERGVASYVPRLPRTYGPTALPSDSKAIAQFIRAGVEGRDIVLKSSGSQRYSFLCVDEVVSALLHVLTRCEPGVPYNVADERSDASLREVAETVAAIAGTKVSFESPDAVERRGFSNSEMGIMDAGRLRATGWRARRGIGEGLERTMSALGRLM